MLVALDNVCDNSIELGFTGAKHHVSFVETNHRTIRRDWHHSEVVDGRELISFGHCGAGHAR